MKQDSAEPWAMWAAQAQKWFENPSGINPFAASAGGFPNPFAMAQPANPLDPQSIMKAIDPAELDRRISELRSVEAWLKMSVAGVEMSIKTMQMQRDAYASLHKMSEAMQESAKAAQTATASAAAGAAESFRPTGMRAKASRTASARGASAKGAKTAARTRK